MRPKQTIRRLEDSCTTSSAIVLKIFLLFAKQTFLSYFSSKTNVFSSFHRQSKYVSRVLSLLYIRLSYILFLKGSDDMKRSELLKILKKHGCKLVRNGSRHDIFYSPLTNQEFPVWRHGKDIPKGTATEILKQAGIQ